MFGRLDRIEGSRGWHVGLDHGLGWRKNRTRRLRMSKPAIDYETVAPARLTSIRIHLAPELFP